MRAQLVVRVRRVVGLRSDDVVTRERIEPAVGKTAGHQHPAHALRLGVVDRPGAVDADREAEAVDRRVVADRSQQCTAFGGMCTRSPWRISRSSPAIVMIPRPDGDVIELVRRVVVRVDEPAARDLELADELEVPALGDVEHLPRVHQPPHGHGAVVLDDRLDVLDRPHVHFVTSAPAMRLRLTPASA